MSNTSKFDTGSNKVVYILLLLIVCIGMGLRVYRLDSKSLWYDELHSIIPTHPKNSLASVIEYATGDQPPLFFVALHSWFRFFSYSEFNGKLFCALLGGLGIVAMFFFGKSVGDLKVGLVASFLTAINVFHIYYSQELRFYSLLFLVSTICCHRLLCLLRQESLRNWIGFIVSITVVLYTHYYGLVVAAAVGILFVIVGLSFRKPIGYYIHGLLSAVIVVILFSPWIPIIFRDMKVTSFWIDKPDPLFIVEYFRRYFQGWWGQSYKYVVLWTLILIIVYFFVQTALQWRLKSRNDQTGVIVIVGWLVLTLAIPYFYSIIRLPLLLDRYTLISLPSLLIIISIGLTRINKRWIKFGALALIMFFSVRSYGRYIFKYEKSNWEELSKQVIRENLEHDPVLSSLSWHFNYFFTKHQGGSALQVPSGREHDLASWPESFWLLLPQESPEATRKFLDSNCTLEKRIDLGAGGTAFRYHCPHCK